MKYELLDLFNIHIKENKINISKDDSITVNKTLINTRNDFTFEVPSYEDMIIEMREWIYNHKSIYSHYNLR